MTAVSLIDAILEPIRTLEPWDAVGFFGHLIFFSRFVVQWIATERKKQSVVPVAFWYLSLLGSLITLVYAVHVGKLVFILAYSLNMFFYVRNLCFIHRKPGPEASTERDEAVKPADSQGPPDAGRGPS